MKLYSISVAIPTPILLSEIESPDTIPPAMASTADILLKGVPPFVAKTLCFIVGELGDTATLGLIMPSTSMLQSVPCTSAPVTSSFNLYVAAEPISVIINVAVPHDEAVLIFPPFDQFGNFNSIISPLTSWRLYENS